MLGKFTNPINVYVHSAVFEKGELSKGMIFVMGD